jgi:hypothetical protein
MTMKRYQVMLALAIGINLQGPALYSQPQTGMVVESASNQQQSSQAGRDALVAVQAKEIELIREFQGDLLTTVYWALGGTFALTTLLLGFGWFLNFRVYERDKNALHDELLGVLRQEQAKLREELKAENEASRKSALEAAKSANDMAVRTLQREVSDLKLASVRERVERHKEKNAPGMVITHGIDWLELALKVDALHDVSPALETLIDAIADGGKLFGSELTELTTLLSKVPEQHEVLRERLRRALADAKLM